MWRLCGQRVARFVPSLDTSDESDEEDESDGVGVLLLRCDLPLSLPLLLDGVGERLGEGDLRLLELEVRPERREEDPSSSER